MSEDWESGGFGLYVHWPFCESKCPYCDFNSHVASTISHARWRQAYVDEIQRLAPSLSGRRLDSIFFGGGTPSLMEPETVQAVIDTARKHWRTDNHLEITLEANPASVDVGRFQDFSFAGVSRVSLGVQSLRDDALRLLGRRHSVAEALKAWDVANRIFERTSFDIIYARQFQDIKSWSEELRDVLALTPRHLSLYQLTIEDGTAFGDRYDRGKLPGLPTDDLGADMFELTQEFCDRAGLPGYEISNHAAPGEESRHNLIYWRYGDYLGIGPGAHGRLTINGQRFAQTSIRNPMSWLTAVDTQKGSQMAIDAIPSEEQAEEYLMMSLRLREGCDLDRLARLSMAVAAPESLQRLQDDGLIWLKNRRVGATARGRPLLNGILRALL